MRVTQAQFCNSAKARMTTSLRVFGLRVFLCLLASTCLARADTNVFGLRHSTLGQATLNLDSSFTIVDIGLSGQDGVASELGDADSGVFIYPDTPSVDEGYAMTARA